MTNVARVKWENELNAIINNQRGKYIFHIATGQLGTIHINGSN